MKFFIFGFFLLVQMVCNGSPFYSQFGQDQFVYKKYFKKIRSGIFVDIGAHNGVTHSNTFFFEKKLGWKGICVEPIPEVYDELIKTRKCDCIQGCVSDFSGCSQLLRVFSPSLNTEMLTGLLHKYDQRHVNRVLNEIKLFGGSYEVIDVNCFLLNDILQQSGINHVNFLSIDTEGGEFDLLASIDYENIQIDVITVEDNYNDPRFIPFMKSKGFSYVCRLYVDIIFVNDQLLQLK